MFQRRHQNLSLDPPLDGIMYMLAGFLCSEVIYADTHSQLKVGCVIQAECKIREPLSQQDMGWLRCHVYHWVDKTSLDAHDLVIGIGNIAQTTPDTGLSTIKLSYNLIAKPKPAVSALAA